MTVDVAEQARRAASTFAHPGKFVIGGVWTAAASGATLQTFDPGSGTLLTEVP
jgi:hypothetical protein